MLHLEWLRAMVSMMNRPAREGFDYILQRPASDPGAKATADKWLDDNESRLRWIEAKFETYARKKNDL